MYQNISFKHPFFVNVIIKNNELLTISNSRCFIKASIANSLPFAFLYDIFTRSISLFSPFFIDLSSLHVLSNAEEVMSIWFNDKCNNMILCYGGVVYLKTKMLMSTNIWAKHLSYKKKKRKEKKRNAEREKYSGGLNQDGAALDR